MIKNAITQAFGRLAPTVRLGWRDEENIIVANPDRAELSVRRKLCWLQSGESEYPALRRMSPSSHERAPNSTGPTEGQVLARKVFRVPGRTYPIATP